MKQKNNGITLIALVVTIVVLIILSGISISVLSGQNGILNRSIEASELTEVANTKEKIQLELMSIAVDNNGSYTLDDIETAIIKVIGSTDAFDESTGKLTISNGNEVDLTDIISGASDNSSENVETISTTESYVGYYADVDGNGTVDGVIYADLMHEQTSEYWSPGSTASKYKTSGTYSWETIDTSKNYYIIQKDYSGCFGTKDVISPARGSTGNDRFYVIALNDFTTESYNTFYWYYAAYSNGMSDYATYTLTDFGSGKANTVAMITKWNSSGYGSQNAGSSYLDLWGIIQDEVESDWFIPSSKEWAAFGGELGITTDNYKDTFGLSNYYWSSSQQTSTTAYYAYFPGGFVWSRKHL